MNCKKCGRPMGKKNYCQNCDGQSVRKRMAEQAAKKQKMKKLWYVLGAVALCAVLIVGAILIFGGEDASETPSISGKHHVEIEIQDYGTIKVELDADAAPISVENFLNLAKSGFYTGLKFHRIIEGFMMQGGAGNADSPEVATIKGEFSENGVENPLSHTRGAISMARTDIMDSANSQFFIVHQDYPSLDGKYACFGYVTEGMEIVDAICEMSTGVATDGNGSIPEEYQPIITEVRVID